MTNYFTYEPPLKTWGQWRPASTTLRNYLSGPAMPYSFASFTLFLFSLVLQDLAADLFLQCFLFSNIPRTKSYTVTLPFLILSDGSFPSFSMSFRLFLFLPCPTFPSSSLFSLLFYPCHVSFSSLSPCFIIYSFILCPLFLFAIFYLNFTMPTWTHAF